MEEKEKSTSGCAKKSGNLCLGLLCFISILYFHFFNIHDVLSVLLIPIYGSFLFIITYASKQNIATNFIKLYTEIRKILETNYNYKVVILNQQNSDNNFHSYIKNISNKKKSLIIVQLINLSVSLRTNLYIIYKWLYRFQYMLLEVVRFFYIFIFLNSQFIQICIV